MRFYYCRVCDVPYLTQREADLCMPAELIPVVYEHTVDSDMPHELSLEWLD